VTDQQARVDFVAQYAGDLPWVNISFLVAQADSYFPASQFPLIDTLTFSTQPERGRYYQTKTNKQLSTTISPGCNCSFAGTYPIVGQSWWDLYDDPSQKTNFGLLTLRDDPYNGVASTPNPGVDQWGYPTGCQGADALPGPTTPCEQGSYGDALDSIITANSIWLTHAVSAKDFRISAAPASVSVTAGGSAVYMVSLTPQGGFEGTLQVTCVEPSALTESTCSASPTSVMVSSSSAATATVTVSTTAPSMAPQAHQTPLVPGGKPLLTPLLWLAAIVALGLGRTLASTRAEGRRPWAWMLPVTPALAVLLWASCGGSGGGQVGPSNPGTPAGTYNLTLSAQGGNLTHTAAVSLTVQ
jgi:hypothetical protein